MSLPTLTAPTFVTTIPSTGEKIKFRPFLVKEEKILLIALQDGEEDTILASIKEIINNCTFNALNVDDLTSFDLDFLFLQLRIKSKGGIVELKFKCQNELTEKTPGGKTEICGHVNTVSFDLEKVKLVKDPNHTKKIMLTDKVGLIMKYPSFKTLKSLNGLIDDNNVDKLYDVFSDFIETVFDGDTVFDSYTKEEMQEFVESFSDDQFKKVKDFFETMPKLVAEIPIKCEKCGHTETIKVEGLQNFLE